MPSQDRRNCDSNMARVKGRIGLRGVVMSCDLLADGRQVICEDIRHHIQDVCLLNLAALAASLSLYTAVYTSDQLEFQTCDLKYSSTAVPGYSSRSKFRSTGYEEEEQTWEQNNKKFCVHSYTKLKYEYEYLSSPIYRY